MFCSPFTAPQGFSQPLSFNAPACTPMMGASPLSGGWSLMMVGLQQQLLMTMAQLLSTLAQGGLPGQAPAGGVPTAPSFGAGGAIGQAGLGNFLGGTAPSGAGWSRGNSRPGSAAGGGAVGGSGNTQDHGDNKFTTLNVNIKSRPAMSQKAVLHDVNKAAKNADLIGWNEISLDRYRHAIKSLGPEWGHYMPKDGKYTISNPISYKKDEWKLLKGGFEKTHDGAFGICPDRYITWARLKHRGTGEKVVRINTHLVAGAFSKGSSHNAWRRSSWNTHMNKLSSMVRKFEGQGYKVIIGGDFNKDSSKVLGNGVNYDNKLNVGTHDGGSTLDYLMSSRQKGLKNNNGGVLGGFRSDHNAVYGNYTLG